MDIDRIIAFENGELDEQETLSLLQSLVDDGTIWRFQGSYGRLAADLLEAGLLKFPEERTYDSYGNPIPTRAEWNASAGAADADTAETDAEPAELGTDDLWDT